MAALAAVRLLRCGAGDNWDNLSAKSGNRPTIFHFRNYLSTSPTEALPAGVGDRETNCAPACTSQGVCHAASHHFRSDAAGRTTTMPAVRSANVSFADRTNQPGRLRRADF